MTSLQENIKKLNDNDKNISKTKQSLSISHRLRLPESVNHWTPAPTHLLVEPLPCLRVDGLADSTQNPQTGQVVPDKGANRVTLVKQVGVRSGKCR